MPGPSLSRSGRPVALIVIASAALLLAPHLAIAASASISGFAYSPDPITVTVGDSITWTNNDPVAHTVTADDGSFNSGSIAAGATFSHTFTTVGSVPYHCNIHRSMHGTVQVQAAPAPTPTPRRSPRPTSRITPPPADTTAPGPGDPAGLSNEVYVLMAVFTVVMLGFGLRIGRPRRQ